MSKPENILFAVGVESLPSVVVDTLLGGYALGVVRVGPEAIGPRGAGRSKAIAQQLDLAGVAIRLGERWTAAGYAGYLGGFQAESLMATGSEWHVDDRYGPDAHHPDRAVALSVGQSGTALVHAIDLGRVMQPNGDPADRAKLAQLRREAAAMGEDELPEGVTSIVVNEGDVLVIPSIPRAVAHRVDLDGPRTSQTFSSAITY